jgi:IclR family acetate operon transcriptional repressor
VSAAGLRALDVIDAVTASVLPVSLAQIMASTKMSKATAYRLVEDLCQAGFLLREPKGTGFSAGPRLNAMSLNLMSNGAFRSARRAILQTLVSQIGETCNFTTFHDGAVLYVDRVEASWPLRLHLQPGSVTPLFCTSSGKLYLSLMPTAQRKRLLMASPIPRFTPKTITDPRLLELELARIRKLGVSTDDEGYLEGLISVALPVYGLNRSILGTVAVHAPVARLSLERGLAYVPQIRRAASELASAYRRVASA